ncbi:SRPBCC family protein [Pirellulaceae bacterium]|jgi:hypothetical protein|nr:SRPBCC family protein [Pirellulaceae bacterium]
METPDSQSPNAKPHSFGVGDLFSLWFTMSREVTRRSYILSGFGLMLFKYVVELAVIQTLIGYFYDPIVFLSPLYTTRHNIYANTPIWVAWAFFFWSLPFLWISVSMSVRRSIAATGSAILGLAVLLPGINYLAMFVLCMLPTRHQVTGILTESKPTRAASKVRGALRGILICTVIAIALFVLTVYVIGDYGYFLFLGLPILIGVTSAYSYNHPVRHNLIQSMAVSQIALLILCGCLLIFAAEGVICIVMLLPLGMIMTAVGGLIGYAMATTTVRPVANTLMLVAIFPMFFGADVLYHPTPLYEVQSSIEIDAPPEDVWPNVVGFSDLKAPPAWYFKLGIAYPVRATIKGTGVGAIRHCEFSTGSFVEPITIWDEPNRLAFDVTSQPPPMNELSPYQHVHPPHLDGYLRCQRGEFRLIRLPDNRTRLEGSTWYEFEMYPQGYWTLWSDWSIQQIHKRVLQHIKTLSE